MGGGDDVLALVQGATAKLPDCAIAGSCDQCFNGYFPNPATKVCTKCSDTAVVVYL